MLLIAKFQFYLGDYTSRTSSGSLSPRDSVCVRVAWRAYNGSDYEQILPASLLRTPHNVILRSECNEFPSASDLMQGNLSQLPLIRWLQHHQSFRFISEASPLSDVDSKTIAALLELNTSEAKKKKKSRERSNFYLKISRTFFSFEAALGCNALSFTIAWESGKKLLAPPSLILLFYLTPSCHTCSTSRDDSTGSWDCSEVSCSASWTYVSRELSHISTQSSQVQGRLFHLAAWFPR